jgi:hypothetical protein
MSSWMLPTVFSTGYLGRVALGQRLAPFPFIADLIRREGAGVGGSRTFERDAGRCGGIRAVR